MAIIALVVALGGFVLLLAKSSEDTPEEVSR